MSQFSDLQIQLIYIYMMTFLLFIAETKYQDKYSARFIPYFTLCATCCHPKIGQQ